MKQGKIFLAVGIGGVFGAAGRYGISVAMTNWDVFPFATLTVNFVGCFLLSWLSNYTKSNIHPTLFIALSTGLIGSFTTFSTFTVETVELAHTNLSLALLYIFISIFGGLLCCYLGFRIANKRRLET